MTMIPQALEGPRHDPWAGPGVIFAVVVVVAVGLLVTLLVLMMTGGLTHG